MCVCVYMCVYVHDVACVGVCGCVCGRHVDNHDNYDHGEREEKNKREIYKGH